MKKVFLLQVIILAMLVSTSFGGNNPDKEVKKAFELRLNGKVDEAKTMLESILAKDSTNAMAYYELARLKHYLLLGGGERSLEPIKKAINKAVTLEPKNVTYAYYNAIVSFLETFMTLESGEGDAKSGVNEACGKFKKVLELKPDYYEAMLYLVEFYGMLPKEMGGDSLKAVGYADKLALMDKYFGAKAKAALAPESADHVKFWEDLLAADPSNPNYLAEAGKACLFKDDTVKAQNYFYKAIKSDKSKNTLILDLGRYHMMMVMQNQDLAATELPAARLFLDRYISTGPIVPLKAYTLGLESITARFLGNNDESAKLEQEAKSLDPYFSRAMGVPTLLLFDPPEQVSHHYFSFFSPF
jgi:tetratricopeptide (TPR) repeat protein